MNDATPGASLWSQHSQAETMVAIQYLVPRIPFSAPPHPDTNLQGPGVKGPQNPESWLWDPRFKATIFLGSLNTEGEAATEEIR